MTSTDSGDVWYPFRKEHRAFWILLAEGFKAQSFAPCSLCFCLFGDFVIISASIQLVYEAFSSLGGTSSRGQSVCKKCTATRRNL